MPYIDYEENKRAKERRVRECKARKAINPKCRYGEQLCATCEHLESCEDDGEFLADLGE